MTLKYYNSLIVLFVFGLIGTYYQPANGSVEKIFLNFHIYLSLLFIPFQSIRIFNTLFVEKSKFLFKLIIGYGFIIVFLDLFKGELASLLGNPYFGPAFFVPFFILWGSKVNSIYWLHRISIWSVKIGVIIMPFVAYLDFSYPIIAFMPTFFLLLNIKYANVNDRFWIILGTIIGLIVFFYSDYRSGIVRIFISVIVLIIIQLRFVKIYKYFLILLLAIPSYGVYLYETTGESLFRLVSSSVLESENSILTDTRTFLYVETINDLLSSEKILLGKGPVGTYYSDYFEKNSGDASVRHNVEVGLLQYLLKGGVFYLILFFLIVLLAVQNGVKKSNNNYVKSLALLLIGFVLYSFVENLPAYSFYYVINWIIIGICLSRKILYLDDSEIKLIIQKRE